MNTIDLHSHSIASLDGEHTPKKLIDLATKNNLKYYAITDHDDVSSLSSAINYAKNFNIRFIPGIEISAIIEDTPIHITAYNIDYNNEGFKKRNEFVRQANASWGKKLIQKALEYGFKFNPDDVYSIRDDNLICEELVGEIILNDERNNNDERLLEFRKGGKFCDNPSFNFYKEFTTLGKPLYVPYTTNMPIAEVSELIHSTHGKMFLAHPYHNIKYSEELLNKIISYGIDGIEVFSSYHDKDATNYYYNKAIENNLYMSVGSDYHGKSKPSIKLGSIDYDENELNKTIDYILNIG